ncbi:MAG: hypothetical protein RLY16_2904, partial [Bacteroidota bacterium]
MTRTFRWLFSFSIMLLLTFTATAQVNMLATQNLSEISIDEVPDNDISAYYQKALDNGLNDETLFRLLQEKGLPLVEVNKLAARIEKIKSGGSTNLNTDKSNSGYSGKKESKTDKNLRYKEDKDALVPMETASADLSIFGAELFTAKSQVFEPNLRIATPAGYILGPDDELIVNVFGFSEKTYNLTVNAEGNIYIPQVGPVFVNGLSIEQASSKIKSKMASTIYKAIASGQTRVQISLGKIRSIRVTVIGEAKKPGTYTVSSLTTLFNILYLCGGPTDLGSYRTIELIRGNEVKRIADLYGFLLKGNQKDNVLLQEGDVIRIPYYQTRVTLNGLVKHPGKFEMVKNESFEQLLQYCGGFKDEAYKSAVTVYQLTEKQQRILDLPANQYKNYQPKPSDKIVVGKILTSFENKISIAGSVIRPGDYELNTGLTLKELIERAGGLNQDAYHERASISRFDERNMPIQMAFNVDSILNNLASIVLKKNDSVTIYSIFELNNLVTVNIDGNVKKPGKYKWAENLSLQDLILRAGGFNESGDAQNIEIARRINNVSLTQLNHIQTEIITINLADSGLKHDILLKPYDVINIRQKTDFASQRTVFVEGLVIHPGRYTLKMSNDRISDVINRAGGFRANADTTALVIRRISKKNFTTE